MVPNRYSAESLLLCSIAVCLTAATYPVSGCPEPQSEGHQLPPKAKEGTYGKTLPFLNSSLTMNATQDTPPSVPYTLAVHNSRSLSSSTENNQTLMRQVTANKAKLSRLEEEREQLVLDLQLLTIKYEKEQKVWSQGFI